MRSWSASTRADGALAEGALPSDDNEGSGLQVGRNSYLQAAWLPPDPPPGHGVHRYAFQLFALDRGRDFDSTPGRDAVLAAIKEHGLASGCLIGTYERPGRVDQDAGRCRRGAVRAGPRLAT